MYILICDDEPAVARQVEQLARQHLEQRGIPVQCTVCTRGEEVLARSDLAQYQLALLDVDLETMTGIALGRRLKQQNPELVLVYISAYLEFAPEGYTVRAFRYLLKRDMERMLPSCLDAVLAEHSRECRTCPSGRGGARQRCRWIRSIIWRATCARSMSMVRRSTSRSAPTTAN